MTGEIIYLGGRIAAVEAEKPEWENTERGHACGYLKRAAQEIERDEIPGAIRIVRLALKMIEQLDVDGITLAQDLRELERRGRRLARGAKAAETRRRNKEARAKMRADTQQM
jgi:hypothetical protein